MSTTTFTPEKTTYDAEPPLWLGKAAKLAYENEAVIRRETETWGSPHFQFLEDKTTDTQAFVIANDTTIITAFRGTEPAKFTDWKADIKFVLVDGPGGKVHSGFLKALNSIYEPLRVALTKFHTAQRSLWFTGHSLGTALATLAVAKLAADRHVPIHGLYTFGQPRTGNEQFVQQFDRTFKARTFRFVNNNDLVTRLPPDDLGYEHVGNFLYFTKGGDLKTRPDFFSLLRDRLKGRLEDLFDPGTDGMKDHRMDRYVKNLEKKQTVDL